MTNKEIGQKFFQIAKILELKDPTDRFRIIAYERAAQTLENYPEDLTSVYNRGGLKELKNIPNIGASIAEKIEELIKTGKIKYLGEISKEVPVNEVQFIQIPGVGPKTAIKIARELKARNIDDLEKKLKSGKADKVFKEKTGANILRGIQIMKRMTGRMIITEALPIAEEFVEKIRKIPGVKKADYVGSLRRMKETIGDIDIIAASVKPSKLIEAFIKFPGVTQVLTKGKAKSTVIHSQGTQIDLEILPADEYGSLLQHFTGSKEHNVAMRTYAQTKNMSFSEHGFKYAGKIHKFSSEKDVYGFLKMDWIPPELRENRGEIQTALKHNLPELVELVDIRGDLHVHSNWSDGLMNIDEIAKKAESLGYEYVVIADHTVGLGIARGLDEKRLQERQKEIEKVQNKYPKVRILSSVEVNIKANGDLDIQGWMLKKLDIVTASVHTSFYQDRSTMTQRLLKAIAHPHVDIIGHPSGRIIGQREPYEADWPAVFRACVEHKTVLEISAFPNRLDLRDTLCQEAKRYGVKFAISTDAHQLHHLELMRFGVSVARRGWLGKEDIVNCLEIKSLSAWAQR